MQIACPASPDKPLHLAEYEADAGLLCETCGYFTEAELVAQLEAELARFAVKFPGLVEGKTLREQEAEVEKVSALLLRSLPAESEELVLELVVAWGLSKFGHAVPEEHLLSCVDRALRKRAA